MSAVLPGATIGIVGGGQLARMLALEARRMGYRIAVLDPDFRAPAARLADRVVAAALDDRAAAVELASASDVVTLDTEHVPADVLESIESVTPLLPGSAIMRTVQDRLAQRDFLAASAIPQPRYRGVERIGELWAAVEELGTPCVLKTRRDGYDGKGQALIRNVTECEAAWTRVGRRPAVLEEFVDFVTEVSVILARERTGRIACYPLAENRHVRHVLRTTIAPARLAADTAAVAEETGRRIAEALGYAGVMAVELFVTRAGGVLVNEIAPRVHNSGHYTFGGCVASQFEQHIRAICGLPLGATELPRPAVMLNLLGDLWTGRVPDWSAVLRRPAARLHLYDKAEVVAGRKMGHVLVTAGSVEQALRISEDIAGELGDPSAPDTFIPRTGELCS